MPAYIPGATNAQNAANPSTGQAVIFDALSGPKGSPLDKGVGTGAMMTGIGWGCNAKANVGGGANAMVPDFTDNTGEVPSGANSTRLYLGGGRCNANSGGYAAPNPYTVGFAPGNAGNGTVRDAGAGPAYTCLAGRWVTATGTVANGAEVEAGYNNSTGRTITTGQHCFGAGSVAQPAPS
jgi:hypothetical protein